MAGAELRKDDHILIPRRQMISGVPAKLSNPFVFLAKPAAACRSAKARFPGPNPGVASKRESGTCKFVGTAFSCFIAILGVVWSGKVTVF